MRPVHSLPSYGVSSSGVGPVGGQGQTGQAGQTGQVAVVAITSSHYDKRGLLSRDGEALLASLRSLAYLTLANTHVVSQLMLADGGVSLLVSLLEGLLVASKSPGSPGLSESQRGNSSNRIANLNPPFDFSADDRLTLASHALSAATNLVLRGRSKVRDALVEAGLVKVLVAFLEPVVAAVEELQRISTAQPALAAVSTPTESTSMDIDASLNTQQHSQSVDNSQFLIPSSVLATTSSTEPNTPAPIQPEQQQQQQPHPINALPTDPATSLPHAPSAAEPATAAAQPPPPQQQRQEVPILPGIRLPLPSSPETAHSLSKIVPHQHHILMAIKILHMVSKYPHLRHYMHIDNTRPLRPFVKELCGAAIAAADAEKPAALAVANSTSSSSLSVVDASSSSANGLGLGLDLLTNVLATTPTIVSNVVDVASASASATTTTTIPNTLATVDIDQIRRVNFDRFDSTVGTAATATSLAPQTTTPATSVMHRQLFSLSASINNTSKPVAPLPKIQPIITNIPMLVFAHEDPMELELLESLTTLPESFQTPLIASKNHLIQTTLHYAPKPSNTRSAFELLEVFTGPCSLIPEARNLAVGTLRNAYRRDPVPTPAEPPFVPLNQAMGPCMYLDADEFCSSGKIRKAGPFARSVVVGLGHLRRCANSRCGKWENGYKQFSKCTAAPPVGTVAPATIPTAAPVVAPGVMHTMPLIRDVQARIHFPTFTTTTGTAAPGNVADGEALLAPLGRRASSDAASAIVVTGGGHEFMEEGNGDAAAAGGPAGADEMY
ncbi:UNVERIFIED_CONTAM: hypothetical protein HDU68_007302 [Siphonaria sp. JEL0065]|nr:hypothetical protein HDU68_007302 [Siphonaria sp. JEL0065]